MDTLSELLPDFYSWSDRVAWEGRPGETFLRTGFVAHLPAAGVLALVDPPAVGEGVAGELERLGPPTHVLLTSNWHLRESETLRERWGLEIWLNEIGLAAAATAIDGTFRHRDRLWDAIDVIHLPHVYWPEETALFVRAASVLIVGDALCGGREDLGVSDGEIGIFTTQHILDPQAARLTFTGLLDVPFTAICFGHGAPVLDNPQPALRRFLQRTLLV